MTAPMAAAPTGSMAPAIEVPGRRRTFLACVGDITHPDTWSSTPYHLLEAGMRLGIIHEGLTLDPRSRRLRINRVLWNAWRCALADAPGGYQYSIGFLESLWRPFRAKVRGGVVIGHHQLFAPTVLNDPSIEKWFYIDATLTVLCKHYKDAPGRRSLRERLRRERENYRAAAGVICMSQFAADSVVDDYGIPASKVHVILPGANITGQAYQQWEREAAVTPDPSAQPDRPLRMVFVGREVARKGLDRLLGAMSLAKPRGLKATLRVIGLARTEVPPRLRDIPGVEWVGRVYRRTEGQRFLRLLGECDVGCLLSRADFSAIALREYLALGMAVIGPDVGGCMALMHPEASIAVKPDAPDEQVAQVLLALESDPARVARMRATAWRHRRSALWDASVLQIAALLNRGYSAL